MPNFVPAHTSVDAEYYPEASELKLGIITVPVPAEHYVARYEGGVLVLPKGDFEALFKLQEGPSVRCYQ